LKESLPVSVGDYAANIGTTGSDSTVFIPDGPPIEENGPFRAVTGVRFLEITDGLTHTLLVGEKHVPRGLELTHPWDCGLYDGHNPICNTRAAGPDFPLAVARDDPGWKFGSHHPGLVQFVFCDGSVRALINKINPDILGLLAQRNDGAPTPEY
jgi:prepilin-type processing-associated H-X9-DG protein